MTAFGRKALPWLVPMFILVAWQLTTEFGVISSRSLPQLSAVAKAGWDMAGTGELEQHIAISAMRAFAGFAIGGSIGFLLGLLNGVSLLSHKLLDSTVQMVRNIPHLALIPLVILWFGIDEKAKLFLVAFGVFFPIYINTFHGIRTVDPALIEMGRVYGLKRWLLFREIIFPSALPSILVGFRFGLGIMWLTLIVAETVSASSGIGYMTMNAREFLQTDVMVLGILIYAVLGKLADVAVRAIEFRALSWNPAFQRA
jgi:sulfonate transport system permease protein